MNGAVRQVCAPGRAAQLGGKLCALGSSDKNVQGTDDYLQRTDDSLQLTADTLRQACPRAIKSGAAPDENRPA